MIVQRVIVKVKPKNRDALIELLKAAREGLDNPEGMRIPSPLIGVPYTTVVYELINEDLAENRQGWDEFYSRPESDTINEKWLELVEDNDDEFYTIEA